VTVHPFRREDAQRAREIARPCERTGRGGIKSKGGAQPAERYLGGSGEVGGRFLNPPIARGKFLHRKGFILP
jgi:hypothetical protein